MRRLPPGMVCVPEDQWPEPELDEARIYRWLVVARVSENKHAAVVEALRSTMIQYCQFRAWEQESAPLGEIRIYMERLRTVIAQLSAIIDGNGDRAARAMYDAMILEAEEGWEQIAAFQLPEVLQALLNSAERVAEKFEENAQVSSGKIESAIRHRRLAHSILKLALVHGLPGGTRPNGLIIRLFRECLRSVGESQANPARVFREAGTPTIEENEQFVPVFPVKLS